MQTSQLPPGGAQNNPAARKSANSSKRSALQRRSDKALDRNAAILDIVRKARSAVQTVLAEQLESVEIKFT